MILQKIIHLLACLLTYMSSSAFVQLKASAHVPAPDSIYWQMHDGKFSLSPNKNLADSLPPTSYDPKTGSFKDAEGKPFTGDVSAHPVRGTDLDGITKSVDGLGADPITAKQAYELHAKQDWPALEKLFTEKGLNGGWPPNRGFIDMKPGTLKAGDSFDRFGGKINPDTGKFEDGGRFVALFQRDPSAPLRTSFGGRALPQTHLDGDPVTGEKPAFKGYQILKDIPVTEGDAIPWFGQPGGGKQYELPPGGIDKLIADGYIGEIDAPDLNGPKTEGGTPDMVTNTTPVNENSPNNGDGNDNSTPDPSKIDSENNNSDPVKENVDGDGEHGGGMRGKDVYGYKGDTLGSLKKNVKVDDPKNPGKKINQSDYSDIDALVASTLANSKANLIPGVVVTPIGGSEYQVMATVPGPGGTTIQVPVKVQIYYNNDSGHSKATSKSVHPADETGPAFNTTKYNADTGEWTATMYVNMGASQKDLNKMLSHEFNEIGSIVVAEHGNMQGLSQSDADQRIQDQQKASVFDKNVTSNGPINPQSLTAHDKAAIKELETLASEVGQNRQTGGPSGKSQHHVDGNQMQDPYHRSQEESLSKLLQEMGITNDPDRLKLVLDMTNLTPEAKRWLQNHYLSTTLNKTHEATLAGNPNPFTPESIDHVVNPSGKNANAGEWVDGGISGGHDDKALNDFVANNPQFQIVKVGDGTITSPSGITAPTKKYDQYWIDPNTPGATPVLCNKPKSTIDASPETQMRILSDTFFTNMYPGIIASTVDLTNNRVTTVINGVTVEAWVTMTAGKPETLKINSIYFVA